MKRSGIYCIEHIASGKKYIGSAVDIQRRWGQHKKSLRGQCHHSRYLQRAWNKYGENAFTFSVVEDVKTTDLIKREQHWLDALKTCDPTKGFNLSPTASSTLGYKHTAATCEKYRLANLGRKMSDDTKAKMSLQQQGSKNAFAIMNEKDVAIARERVQKGDVQQLIADELGVSLGTLNKAIRGTAWVHVSTAPVCTGMRKGDRHGMAKLDWGTVRKIKTELSTNRSVKSISSEFHISRQTVTDIKFGRTWREE